MRQASEVGNSPGHSLRSLLPVVGIPPGNEIRPKREATLGGGDLVAASLKCISGAGHSYHLEKAKQAQILQEGCVN